MLERKGIISSNGEQLTLVGNEIKVGDKAPDFKAVDTNMKTVNLSDFLGKTVIISSVPSLDTPICNLQTRRFAAEAKRMGPDVVILTISMDLPFAQKRWCGESGVTGVITLSDYRWREFGEKYGLLIEETLLLARAVIIVNKQGVVEYVQIVSDLGHEPNYESVLDAISDLEVVAR